MKKFLLRFAVLLAVLLIPAAGVLFSLWRASQVVPDFYLRSLESTPRERQAASETMLQKTATLVSDLRRQGRWEALFTQDEINGFLAVDLEKNHPDSLPPDVADPRVVISEGGLQLACRAKQRGIETVLSAALDVYLDGPNVIGVRLRSVRAGALPLPMGSALDQISSAASRMGLRIQWQQADGDPVALIAITPHLNDGQPVVVEVLELAEQEVYLAGSTLEPGETGVPAE